MVEQSALIMALPSESKGLFEQAGIQVHYSGIGKVNAAFNLGTAGSSHFETHSLVEVSSFVQRDMDVSPLGFVPGITPMDEEIPGCIELVSYFDQLPKGICGTGDSFETGLPKVSCDLVDMEGYALAKVCKKLGVRLVSVKYISDGANTTAHLDWENNLLLGAHKLLDLYQQARLSFQS